MNELEKEWTEVCSSLKGKLGEQDMNRWFGQIAPHTQKNGTVTFFAPTRFIAEWIKKNYSNDILTAWQDVNPDVLTLRFKVAPLDLSQNTTEEISQPEIISSPAPVEETHSSFFADDSDDIFASINELSTTLDPAYTFDNFVVGKPNEFAYSAARRVAEHNDVSFNPLYLHGGVGLGKTHLMQSIAWKIRELSPKRKVLYLSAEKFMYSFVKALRHKDSVFSFKNLFRSVDVLMIDDVQFLCGKDSTQEEFFHTFNSLIEQGKQIIVTADSPSVNLEGISDRLKTRLGSGLVVDIYPTTYELRLGILQSKAQMMNENVPKEIIEFLAEHISTNVRELEGALRRVVAHAQLIGQPISLEGTKELLQDLLGACERRATVEEIQKKVAEYYGLRVADLKSVRREQKIVRPRQIAMYLSKVLTTKSLPQIGLKFERDHTTVIHAIKTIEKLLDTDANIAEDIRLLKKNINI